MSLDQEFEWAVQAHQRGDLAAAMAGYRRVLAAAPDNARAGALLGTALLQTDAAAQALPLLQNAAAKLRNDLDVLGALAQAYFSLSQYPQAADTYRKALRIAPAAVELQLGLANSMAVQGQYADARRMLERVLARQPDNVMVWFNLGNVLRDMGESAPAAGAYREALKRAPDMVQARNGLGSVLHSALKLDEAEREYRRCVHDAPQFLTAWQNLASVLGDMGRHDASEQACRDALRLAPSNTQTLGMLADSFNARGRMHEALRYYAEALKLAPESVALRLSYATKLCDTGDVRGGLAEYALAMQRAPDAREPHQTVATTLLAHGFLAEGWARYRQRPAFFAFQEKLPVTLTQSLPESLEGKSIGVLREQGLGDEIFFLRYVAVLARRGAHVTYRSARAIAGLVKRIEGVSAVIDAEAPLPACDAAILAGDLPHALALPVDGGVEPLWDFPWTQSMVAPLPPPGVRIAPLAEALHRMRNQLAQLGPPPYVGITWRGGTPPTEQGAGNWMLFKELDIAGLGAALQPLRGTFIALQRNPSPGELAAMAAALGAPVHDLTALNADLETMLALLALIDEYVGVSNTNMHLRAAAGKSARVLVPSPAEWRWMASGPRSPWFPGFSIYRQSNDGEWAGALAKLTLDLAATYP